MSIESKTANFKELEFTLEKKGNKYVFSVDKASLDLSRFFISYLYKFDTLSDEEFSESDGLSISLAGSVDMLIHIGSDYNIQEIDGKTGWESWLEDISEEDLTDLTIKVCDYNEVYFQNKINIYELSKEEKKALQDFISDRVRYNEISLS